MAQPLEASSAGDRDGIHQHQQQGAAAEGVRGVEQVVPMLDLNVVYKNPNSGDKREIWTTA